METRIVLIGHDQQKRDWLASGLSAEAGQVFRFAYAGIDVAAVKACQPDLIILDFNPIDTEAAWELLMLHKMNDSTANIPILITTTPFQLSAAMRDYLLTHYVSVIHEPYELEPFIALIHRIIREARQSASFFDGDRTLPILIADDNDDLRDITTTVLRLEDYRVVTAHDGLVALDRVSRADFCLILIDLAMPLMNGYEFLGAYERQLRPHAPVIIFTAEGVIHTERLPAFVVATLIKPFHIKELIKLVSQYALPVLH